MDPSELKVTFIFPTSLSLKFKLMLKLYNRLLLLSRGIFIL